MRLSLALESLLASPLGSSEWPLEYWSRERLFSAAARRAWVEPDLRRFPFADPSSPRGPPYSGRACDQIKACSLMSRASRRYRWRCHGTDPHGNLSIARMLEQRLGTALEVAIEQTPVNEYVLPGKVSGVRAAHKGTQISQL
jgi:hypothetical protein